MACRIVDTRTGIPRTYLSVRRGRSALTARRPVKLPTPGIKTGILREKHTGLVESNAFSKGVLSLSHCLRWGGGRGARRVPAIAHGQLLPVLTMPCRPR